jgi:hypothetical protein
LLGCRERNCREPCFGDKGLGIAIDNDIGRFFRGEMPIDGRQSQTRAADGGEHFCILGAVRRQQSYAVP